MSAPKKTKRPRTSLLTTAHHEAGHFVAHCVLSPGDRGEVSINPKGHTFGMSMSEDDVERPNPGRPREREIVPALVEIAVVVLLAGFAAEVAFHGDVAAAKLGAGSDFEKVDEFLGKVDWHDETIDMARERLLQRTRALVEKHRVAIDELASALMEYRELRGEDAEAVVADATEGIDWRPRLRETMAWRRQNAGK